MVTDFQIFIFLKWNVKYINIIEETWDHRLSDILNLALELPRKRP